MNNKILRVVQSKSYNSPVFGLYKAYNTFPILQLHVQQILLFVHRYDRHLLPTVFVTYFDKNQTMYSHNNRNKTNLYLYGVNCMFGEKCITLKAQHCME